MKKEILLGIVYGLLLSACYQDINLEGYRGNQIVVLNGMASGDTVIMADVSRTWFYTDSVPSNDIEDLIINVYVNNVCRGTMTYNGRMYLSDIRPQAGDSIRLVTHVGGEEISAEDCMPEKTSITDVAISFKRVKTENGSISVDGKGHYTIDDYNDEFTYLIRIPGKSEERKCYFLSIETVSNLQILGTLDYSLNPAFLLTSERINRTVTNLMIEGQLGLPFTNEGFVGDEYTVVIKEIGSPSAYASYDRCLRRVCLYTISEPYYKYIITRLSNDSDFSLQSGLAGSGIVEPVRIFSNINGGTGIFGCVQKDCRIVSLFDSRNASYNSHSRNHLE